MKGKLSIAESFNLFDNSSANYLFYAHATCTDISVAKLKILPGQFAYAMVPFEYFAYPFVLFRLGVVSCCLY